jgi:hypothetical protein
MKDMFEHLWKVAPQLMSVVGIIAILFMMALKVSQFQLEFENMNRRLTRVEEKVDVIIEYLLRDKAEQQTPNGK